MICFRLIDEEDVKYKIKNILGGKENANKFTVDAEGFKKVPNTTFSYWVSDYVRGLFEKFPSLSEGSRDVQRGLSTNNNFRYVRCWWEVPARMVCPPDRHEHNWTGRYCVVDAKWFPIAMGNSYTHTYPDVHTLVNWDRHGIELECDTKKKYPYLDGNVEFVLHREKEYYHPGLTYSTRARRFSTKPVPSGVLFSHTGLVITADSEDLGWISAYLSSDIIRSVLGLIAPPRKLEEGYVSELPVPETIDKSVASRLEEARQVRTKQSQKQATGDEVMLDFQAPSLLTNPDKHSPDKYPSDEINDAVSEILGLDESEKKTCSDN
jgi:hypothetical protein